MECNRDEAIRAKEIAQKKMENKDFEGARKIALRARNLYPELENMTQLLCICDVHCSSQKGLLGSEKDWYGILQVEKFADVPTVKKQYRRLALILHPDKNRFPGAEAAFKLICEANALLTEPTAKSLYDSKIRVSSKSAQVNPPNHVNKNTQPNKQCSARNNISNGHSSLNQDQVTQSTSSVRQEVFWTTCPYCKTRYQYLREFIHKSLGCPTCKRIFVAYEVVGAHGNTLKTKSVPQGAQHVPKPDSSQPAAFHEKAVPNRGKSKMGIQNDKGTQASHAGSQGIASKKTVQPEPGVQTGIGSGGVKVAGAEKDMEYFKTKETESTNNVSVHCEKGGTSNGDATNREMGDVRTKSKKRGRKESNESGDSLSHSDVEDLTMKGNTAGDFATDLKCESTHVHFNRRSSRKRQHVSYEETEAVDRADPIKKPEATKKDSVKEQNDALDGEDLKHSYEKSFCNDVDYSNPGHKEMGTVPSEESLREKDAESDEKHKVRGETGGKSSNGADTVEIVSDSDEDIFSSDDSNIDCPDPEFSDFEKARGESQFAVNQFWACYDTLDDMPRFYAKVKKVFSNPFQLSITWLEADPIDEAYETWVDEELPVGCGSFRHGKTEKTSVRLSFSHQVHFDKGKKRGSLLMYPRVGEVWAIFKDWDTSWSSEPQKHKKFKYEIVEVISDFVAGSGIRVVYLDKVTGFVSLFQRAFKGESSSFVIGPNELYKFSHRVPCFKMSGSEREGVPIGSFELDPASLPLNPDDLFYPGKAKMEDRKLDRGVHCSPPKAGMKNGKSVVSEGMMSTPEKFEDLGGTKGQKFELRKSPRTQNVIRKTAIV